MFVRYEDYDCKRHVPFYNNSLKKYEEFSKQIANALKTSTSLYMYSLMRNVVEDEQFWKKAGNLMHSSEKLEFLK